MVAERLLYLPDIQINIDPLSRPRYIEELLRRDGLTGIVEDPNAAYCPLSLTSTPDELKPIIRRRQDVLMQVLQEAGITAYDPGSSPFSPDAGLTIGPDEIYRVDTGRVVSARFCVSHDILPSTGFGEEEEVARAYNKILVILHDEGIRTSRMQVNRSIHLQYSHFDDQAKEFVEVFRFLRQFEPGMGFNREAPALLGFNSQGAVDLAEAVYSNFPHLKYKFDGKVPIVKFSVINPEIFRENRR